MSLPAPGTMVPLSPAVDLPVLKGIKVHPNDPMQLDFVLDQQSKTKVISDAEAKKLVKYFLASLTTPEQEMWVNLSPYEKDRIVPESFGRTEMGRDLLAQDYLLKQITASLVYPEGDIGKQFWKKVYELSGNKNISVNTFNKVWIVPDKAVVYENAKAGTAYVVESSLKVLTEQDYLAQERNAAGGAQGVRYARSLRGTMALSPATPRGDGLSEDETNTWATGPAYAIRDFVIPQLTKEVNTGANFAQLRQVYNSLILATWYKKKIKDSILSQVYADKSKVRGTEYLDNTDAVSIYQRYLEAFKKGAYNYIKEEQDPTTGQTIPRKYFSGGVVMDVSKAMVVTTQQPAEENHLAMLSVRMQSADSAMTGGIKPPKKFKTHVDGFGGPMPRRKYNAWVRKGREEGYSYEEAMWWYQAKKESNVRIQFWSNKTSSLNYVLAFLDSAIPGFRAARLKNDVKEMARLYKKTVLSYKSKDPEFSADGQQAFFYEVGYLSGFMTNNRHGFLDKNGSPAAVLRFVLPQLVDQNNPDALRSREIEDYYWTEDNARKESITAFDKIEGFKEARLKGDIKRMAEIYRGKILNAYVSPRNGRTGQVAFLYDGGLSTLFSNPRDYFKAGESAIIGILNLVHAGLVDPENKDALHPKEVMYNYWNDPENIKKEGVAVLDTLPGFKEARLSGDVKAMAVIYRRDVMGYKAKDRERYSDGQQAFFEEYGELEGLMRNTSSGLDKLRSPAALLRIALPQIVDQSNPDALRSGEIERSGNKYDLAAAHEAQGTLSADSAQMAAELPYRLEDHLKEIEVIRADIASSEWGRFKQVAVKTPASKRTGFEMSILEHETGFRVYKKRMDVDWYGSGVPYGNIEDVRELSSLNRPGLVPIFIDPKDPLHYYELDLEQKFGYQKLSDVYGLYSLPEYVRRMVVEAVNNGLRFDREYWFNHGHLRGENILFQKIGDRVVDVRIFDFFLLKKLQLKDYPALAAVSRGDKSQPLKGVVPYDILSWMDLRGFDLRGVKSGEFMIQISSLDLRGSDLSGTLVSDESVLDFAVFNNPLIEGDLQKDGLSAVDSAQLAGELSVPEFEARWGEFVQKNGLGSYPLLMERFSKRVKEALLDDSSLRPVFMQVLPETGMEEIQVPSHSRSLVDEIVDGKTLMDYMKEYSSFVVGNAKVAEDLLLSQKGQIVVAVTDKETFDQKDRIFPGFRVANGRQVYFPLANGLWLGIKGSGQNRFSDRPPVEMEEMYGALGMPTGTRVNGISSLSDAARAFEKTAYFDGKKDGIIEFLGYRQIHQYPDGKGGWEYLKGSMKVNGERFFPALVFNYTFTPHRLVKFPQMVRNGEDFQRKLLFMAKALRGAGFFGENEALTKETLVSLIVANIGRVQALKQNKGLYKSTIHSQDFTLLGFEADNEEFYTLEEYLGWINKKLATNNEFFDLLQRTGITVGGLKAGITFLTQINLVLGDDDRKVMIPDLTKGIEALFKAYFVNLDKKHKDGWDKELPGIMENLKAEYARGQRVAGEIDWVYLEGRIREMLRAENKDLDVLKGGIDLNASSINLQLQNTNGAIRMFVDPVMLKQLQNAPGFTPLIINITPLSSLKTFLNS